MADIKIDGRAVKTISVETYQELIKVELNSEDIKRVFPFKPNTPRYSITQNDDNLGYYKVLSCKHRADNETSLLTLHKQ